MGKKVLFIAALGILVISVGLGCGLYSLMKIPLGGKLAEPTPNIQPSLRLPHDAYWRGTLVQVAFTAPSGYTSDAWVGLMSSEVPHGSALENAGQTIDHRYLEGVNQGVLEFAAPMMLGSYDLRMFSGGTDGVETAVTSFTVSDTGMDHVLQTEMRLDHRNYLAGESIEVFFTASPDTTESAWIGIVPSGIGHGSEAVNDQEALEKQYLQGREAGILIFTAPDYFAEYDLRFNDSDEDGSEVYYLTFRVVDY
jgi:hypothetical protein